MERYCENCQKKVEIDVDFVSDIKKVNGKQIEFDRPIFYCIHCNSVIDIEFIEKGVQTLIQSKTMLEDYDALNPTEYVN